MLPGSTKRTGVVDLRLVDLQLRGQLIDHGALRIDGLLARQILRLEHGVAFEIQLSVLQLRGILRLGRDCLFERGLIRARVDLRQQIALVHGLSLRKADLL
jgi:hypothetical protein